MASRFCITTNNQTNKQTDRRDLENKKEKERETERGFASESDGAWWDGLPISCLITHEVFFASRTMVSYPCPFCPCLSLRVRFFAFPSEKDGYERGEEGMERKLPLRLRRGRREGGEEASYKAEWWWNWMEGDARLRSCWPLLVGRRGDFRDAHIPPSQVPFYFPNRLTGAAAAWANMVGFVVYNTNNTPSPYNISLYLISLGCLCVCDVGGFDGRGAPYWSMEAEERRACLVCDAALDWSGLPHSHTHTHTARRVIVMAR